MKIGGKGKGINEIAVDSLCHQCAEEMKVSYVMRNMERAGARICGKCGKTTPTMIYRFTLRGHEYDRLGIEMVFED